jgi:hypothetical protein
MPPTASVRYPSEVDGPNLFGRINIGAALFGHHFPTRLPALESTLTLLGALAYGRQWFFR